MNKYAHLSLEERERLYAWCEKGISQREIARRLRRNVSTVSREVKRNTKYGKEYLPCHAQRRYERVSARQRYNAPLKKPEILLYVRIHLRKPYLWTPEQIAGRLKKDSKGRLTITPECIYQYIYSKRAKKDQFWINLPCGRKKRMRKNGRRVQNKGKVPNAVSISKRPKYIDKRRQAGHWETDNMEGSKSSRAALSVTHERVLRYTTLTKMPNQTKAEKTKAVITRMGDLPDTLKRTLTMDNGKENYGHCEIAKELTIKTYFCHAYTSCEKGSVERRIKDVRRFIPKGTPLTRVSSDKIQWVEGWLNSRPMKCLDWSTPYEKMQQVLSRIDTT